MLAYLNVGSQLLSNKQGLLAFYVLQQAHDLCLQYHPTNSQRMIIEEKLISAEQSIPEALKKLAGINYLPPMPGVAHARLLME